MAARFRAIYGAGPLHLLALLASVAIAGAAVVGWFHRPWDLGNVLVWLVGAIVLHDVVLLPLYTLLDRIAFGALAGRGARPCDRSLSRVVNSTPYLRIPAILGGLLLVVHFPVIFGLGAQTELSASGIPEHGYLARWLLATGVMFALSGIVYAAALARAGVPATSAAPGPGQAAAAAAASAPVPGEATAGDVQPARDPSQPATEPAQTTPSEHTPPASP